MSAIQRTEGMLYTATTKQRDQALAWGNTNTRPSDYKTALTAAASAGRPVHFVVYRDDEMAIQATRQERHVRMHHHQSTAFTAARDDGDDVDQGDCPGYFRWEVQWW